LPAYPKTVRAFIEDRQKAGKKAATIKRYVATIARVPSRNIEPDVRVCSSTSRRLRGARSSSKSLIVALAFCPEVAEATQSSSERVGESQARCSGSLAAGT
jgi:hypothetical protein